MTLFQQIRFKLTLLAGIQTAFALQIDAPPEISEQVKAYAEEAGAENENAVLTVRIRKDSDCNAFVLHLHDKSSKKSREAEHCSNELPNVALQNAVFEIFGRTAQKENSLGGNFKSVLIGLGFAATGVVLYYSKPPKPVYGKRSIVERTY
jgi:hypothetical protein